MIQPRLLMAFLGILLIIGPVPCSALSVGMAPPVIDAGTMLPGESKSMEFFIMSDHDKDIIVSLDVKKASRSFFDPNKGRFRYRFESEEASEEDMTGWITLLRDSVVVPPEKELKHLRGGGMAYANKKVEMIISVPEDAEPGYHAAFISPYPRTGTGGAGTGIGIISVVEMGVVVHVPGNAKREAEVAGITFRRESPEYGTLSILVKNKGTVTLTAMAKDIRLFDTNNKTMAVLASTERPIKPGGIGRLDMRVDAEGLEGKYGVSGNIDWITGSEHIEDVIDIGEYIPAAVTGGVVAPSSHPVATIPIWVIAILVAVLGSLAYWRIR